MNGRGKSSSRVKVFEERTQGPLTVLALVFLVVYAVPIIDPSLPEPWVSICTFASWAIWAIFGVDYLVRFALAENRQSFVRGHVLELIAVLLPMLRPLRALRVLSLANLAARLDEDDNLFVNVAQAIAAAAGLLTFIGAVAILDAEGNSSEANITSFGNALWWSVTTITTVGYGDYFPVTLEGRIVATVMMLLGIALVGVVTAGIATAAVTFLQRNRDGAS